jgi:hypothetical protein
VRELFGNRVASLDMTRKEHVEQSPGGPGDYVDFFKETFGPAIALHEFLGDQPERAAAFDRELREFATRANQGAPESRAEYRYEYLLVVARKQHEA